MPTFFRMSMALARSSFLSFIPWARRPSSICQPMVYTGLSTEFGSWNTMAAWLPRIVRSCSPDSDSTSSVPVSSRFDRYIAPEVVAVSGSSLMMERAVTDLPEPDSPTTPTTVLRGMVKFTSSTALIEPASVMKETDRSLILARSPCWALCCVCCACCVMAFTPLPCCPYRLRRSIPKHGTPRQGR